MNRSAASAKESLGDGPAFAQERAAEAPTASLDGVWSKPSRARRTWPGIDGAPASILRERIQLQSIVRRETPDSQTIRGHDAIGEK
ncbi:hypothetical protein CDD83_1366 [Cordyceps sp. RAO-2017]|nr:hypothetical protein CDD83_1366 [Cordyceps sp. RAO-2017]